MPPFVEVRGWSWRYAGQTRPALTDISFSLSAGETAGVVGRSGSGKSTLLLALVGLIPQSIAGGFAGEVLVGGQRPSLPTKERPHVCAGMVFQDPESQFLGLTVEEEISFPLENAGLEDGEIAARIKTYLREVGLSGFERRSPLELSGGEKQRVALAAALALEPALLLLDEPASELDPEGRRAVSDLMRRVSGSGRCTVVVASHDMGALPAMCSKILVLDEGRLVRVGDQVSLLSLTQDLLSWGVRPPSHAELFALLKARGLSGARPPLTLDEAERTIKTYLGSGALRWQA